MGASIVNIGTILSGDRRRPFIEGDAVRMEARLARQQPRARHEWPVTPKSQGLRF
jgi:hypothetical protein